jgi:hypothetical protein
MKLSTAALQEAFRKNVKALANYLYVLRGSRKGRAKEDWKEAETQLKDFLKSDPDGAQPADREARRTGILPPPR